MSEQDKNPDQQQFVSLRPQLLKDFRGQGALKKNLKIFIEAAKMRGEALDHILLHGPPGLGKTTIAQIIAHEMQVNFKQTSGPLLTKKGDLAAIFSNMQANEVLFIDEIHRMNIAVSEMLYSVMEDFALDVMIGSGPTARAIKIDLPKFTMIGATTRIGLISAPMRDRFHIPLSFEFYTHEELAELILANAKLLKIACDSPGAAEIAQRSRGTPRIAIRILKRVRDFSQVIFENKITQQNVQKSLRALQIDNFGLDPMDRKYLNFIYKNYGNATVGIETIASALNEEMHNIEETIEPFLLKIGFIKKTPRGRQLTFESLNYLQKQS